MSMQRCSIGWLALGMLLVARPGEAGAEAAARVAVRDPAAARDPAVEASQHHLAPLNRGDQRTFTIKGRDAGRRTAATLTERVTSLSLARGVLRAEIAATWLATGGRRAMIGYSARRVEEVDRDGLVRATNRLDRAPVPGSTITGISLPRDLEVGRRWTVRLAYQEDGHQVTSHMRRRVARKVTRRGPDGRLRPGVVVAWNETRSVSGQKRTKVERWTGTTVYLEGLGEVETQMKRRGSRTWFARRLALFKPGR